MPSGLAKNDVEQAPSEKSKTLESTVSAPKGGGATRGIRVKPTAFHGYYLKILKAQGPSAPVGAHSYLINGRMIAALLSSLTPPFTARQG